MIPISKEIMETPGALEAVVKLHKNKIMSNWKEEFNQLAVFETYDISEIVKTDILMFISQLRQKDKEELIKKFSEYDPIRQSFAIDILEDYFNK